MNFTTDQSEFTEEPSIPQLPLWDRIRPLILFVLLLVAIGFFIWKNYQKAQTLQLQNAVVVASHKLVPFQLIQAGDITTNKISGPMNASVLTDTSKIIDQAIVLTSVDEGSTLTADSILIFPPGVKLKNTVILHIPLSSDPLPLTALKPGSQIMLVGTFRGAQGVTDVYSTTGSLIAISDHEAILAMPPNDAERIISYLPPFGQVRLLTFTNP